MKLVKQIFELLTPRERRKGLLLLCMIMIMAMLDMLGVASIMPFMALLANIELVNTNAFLKTAFELSNNLGIDTTEQFLFAFGILVFILLLFSLAFKALTTYVQLKFTLMREYSVGRRLVESYLHQTYSWFLNRNSADFGKTILSEVNTVIFNAVYQVMIIIAQTAVVIALLTLLILVNPKLALISGVTLISSYGLIFWVTRSFLTRIGKERLSANQARYSAVSEAFGAIKEVKVGGLEDTYTRRFSGPAQTYARHQATAQIVSQLPRFALESIAFGGLLMVVLFLMAQSGSFTKALPIIALYALAGYRLMPALQQIYGAITQLRFARPALDALHAELMGLSAERCKNGQEYITFKKEISLSKVHYTYPNGTYPTLKNLNIVIPAKSTVGFVGTTGSGKTTTVDLILGLLEPQEGTLSVDGQIISEYNRRAWQRCVGYVPQQTYLADDTIAANIAFGIDPDDIDQQAVERAAKIAKLHGFVTDELPDQYETTVGERGVRLSGGQRQRIGIARALYNNPQVLIFDEATSALDSITEHAVMEAVHNLGGEITIIMIAHRLSTVRACDTIFLMENGELKVEGTFDTIMQTNERFRTMAENY